MSTIQQLYGIGESYVRDRCHYLGPNVTNTFIAGAELEIEGVRDWAAGWMGDNYIIVENDGSLRKGGKEFLLPPSNKARLVTLFEDIYGHLALTSDCHSVRTSTHVHVNCLWMTEIQVRDLLLLYSIFEPIFFAYVGQERKENIHCMPLGSTHMPNHYGLAMRHIHQKWHKYTALNVLPLCELGTVEFRHLYGTKNVSVFSQWIDMLEILWTAAQSVGGLQRNHLIDLSMLRDIERKLLTLDFYACAKERPEFVLEDNLLDVKLAFL